MKREPNTEYILSLSYGKDSLACLEAIKKLGYPLDRIIHAEVWATDTIPADLPPMVEFKAYADKIIKEKYGIEVEHICAVRGDKKLTYEIQFYEWINTGKNRNRIYGFPYTLGAWCNSRLKVNALSRIGKDDVRKIVLSHSESQKETTRERRLAATRSRLRSKFTTQTRCLTDFQSQSAEGIGVPNSNRGFSSSATVRGAKKNIVQYLGIASDEPERIKRHSVPGKILPLVDIGWDEAYCRKWCEENNLLSPIYTTATRGGCWFCHNQGVDQLRLLRKDYPDLWALLFKWDLDSPTTFKSDGHTVHDYDKRFLLEELELVPKDRRFRWKMLDRYEVNGKIVKQIE